MAGDWIKMRTNLHEDPRVLSVASTLMIPPLHAVGLLWRLWCWADSQSRDGNGLRVTDVTLDSLIGVTGFANSLREVGWLEGQSGCLTLPRFGEHNGQTAKTRALGAKRVSEHRAAKCNGASVTVSLPEKRREEKSKRGKPSQRCPGQVRDNGTVRGSSGTAEATPLSAALRIQYDRELKRVDDELQRIESSVEGIQELSHDQRLRRLALKTRRKELMKFLGCTV